MVRFVLLLVVIVSPSLYGQAVPQATTPVTPHHEANFDAERKQADELFQATKLLEALPLYADLCRQDPTVAVFAERHGAALLAKEASMANSSQQYGLLSNEDSLKASNERLSVHFEAINELKRAQRLGDKSEYVRVTLNLDAKSFTSSVLSGIPLTVGYTYHGKPEAQVPFRDGEAAFGRSDWSAAVASYKQAAENDPVWYDAALYTGDTYFRMKDYPAAGLWFAKAIAIDPDRETAYRYWGDALFHAGDAVAARAKFIDAMVAEPYSKAPFAELLQWAQHTGHQLVAPAITRPEFITPDGALKIDAELAASTKGGRASWIVYQQYRVAHGARTLNQMVIAGGSDVNAVVTPSGYRHTIAEEHAALRAMLADVNAKLKDGTLVEADLDPSIRNLRNLEQADVLGAWIAINAADVGIHSDYPEYRSHHRKHLVDYINAYLIRDVPAAR